MHGIGVADRIDQVTRGAFVVKPGSLFPALRRLEQRGWIGRMGPFGEQPPRALLHAHARGPCPACRREAQLVSHDFGHELDARIGGIGRHAAPPGSPVRLSLPPTPPGRRPGPRSCARASHIVVDRMVARGMTLAEARRAARIEFEGLEQVKEKSARRDGGIRFAVLPPGRALRLARAAPPPVVRRRRVRHAGAGHRRQRGSVQRVLFRADAPTALQRARQRWRSSGPTSAAAAGPTSRCRARSLAEIERRKRSMAGVAGIWS